MSRNTPTPILLDTAILSQIVSDILAALEISPSKKSMCLGKVAARIAGPKHNWGFLTGHQGQLVANGMASSKVKDIYDLPEHIRAGASLALQATPGIDASNIEALEVFLVSAFHSSVPHAAEVFTTAEQVQNDILHNRGHLITEVVALCGEMEKRNEVILDQPSMMVDRFEIAPDLQDVLNRTPWPDLLREYIAPLQEAPTPVQALEDAAAPVAFPTPESWEKAGQILAQSSKVSALLETLPRRPGTFLVLPSCTPTSFAAFPDVLAKTGHAEAYVSFLRDNFELVNASVFTGRLTPRHWDDTGKIALNLLCDSTRPPSLEVFKEYAIPRFGPKLTQMILDAFRPGAETQ